MNQADTRLYLFDGVRGIAAWGVAIFHFIRAFSPAFLNDDNFINKMPISILWNGHFAVFLFFVISAYIFYYKHCSASFMDGIRSSVKRYLRLTIPILIFSLIAFLFHVLKLFYNLKAAEMSQSDWLVRWYTFSPDICFAFTEPIYKMYINFEPLHSYNCNIWTIRYELFFVWMTIAIAIFTTRLNKFNTLILFFIAGLISIGTNAFAFIAGIALCKICQNTDKNKISKYIIFLVLAVGFIFASYNPIIGINSNSMRFEILPISAALIIFGIRRLSISDKINVIFFCIGRYSFGIYITHFIVINSVASHAYVSHGNITETLIVYIASVTIMSMIFYHVIEFPSVNLLNRLFKNIEHKHTLSNDRHA